MKKTELPKCLKRALQGVAGIDFGYAIKKGFFLVVAKVARAGNVASLVESSCTAGSTAYVADNAITAFLNVVNVKVCTAFQSLAVAVDVDDALLVHIACQELAHVQQLAGINISCGRDADFVVANGALAVF